MGSIDIEGYDVEIKDVEKLNNLPETKRLGLIYKNESNTLFGAASGNVSITYLLLNELKSQIVSGGVNVQVIFSSGEEKKYLVNSRIV